MTMTDPIDLEALRAALAVIQRETVRAGGVSFSDGRDLIATHAAVSAALAELTTRRARDAETHNAMAMALQHIRLCAPDPTVDAALEAALLPFQRSDDKGDAT
jgi:hypothetical protein